jgi:hypothetical protein
MFNEKTTEKCKKSSRQTSYFVWVSGATLEKMDFVDSMDNHELTSSRVWTEINPINAIFCHPIGFEVRSLS